MILGNSAFAHRIKNTNDFISFDMIKDEKTQKIHVDISFVDEKNRLNIERLKQNNPEFNDVNFIKGESFYVSRDIEKMSKSRYNVISPDDICKRYGADTLRMYEMFLGPIDQSKPWNTAGISGVLTFLNKFWNLFHRNEKFYVSDDQPSDEVLKIYHKTVKKVVNDIDKFSFNTCVSSLMICVNELKSQNCNSKIILEPLLILLSPFAPHLSEELWELMGNKSSISAEPFPEHDERHLEESSYDYPISFNGKRRFNRKFNLDLNEKQIEKEILLDEQTKKYLTDNSIKKIIIIKKKIINIVF